MNELIKLLKNYDPEKLRNAIAKMEQFEYHRRLVMGILAKKIDPKPKIDRIFPAKMADLVYKEYNRKAQVPNA